MTSSKFGIKADNKLVSAIQNEQWPEKYVPVKGKTASTGSSWLQSDKMEKNSFH